jgi:uncharacterized repeat protein (TIGR01451 family)
LASQGSYDAAAGLWTVGTLGPGGVQTLQLTATATVGSTANTATISHSDQADPNPANNSDTTATSNTAAELQISLLPSNFHPALGETVTFTVTVTNSGPGFATGVQVSAVLPAGLALVSATPSQGSFEPSNGTWFVGTVTTASPVTLTVQATLVGSAVVTQVVSITAEDENDSVPANNTASVELVPTAADLLLSASVDNAMPAVGDTVTFLVGLGSLGPDTATNVTVANPIPVGLTLVLAHPSQGDYSPSTGIWQLGTVTNLDFPTLSLQTLVVGTGEAFNTATITHSDQIDPNSTNNFASAALMGHVAHP